MDIKDFLNHTAAGNAVKAQEILDDILSNKAFEALDEKKTQIAKTLYATEDEVEVQDTADTPVEDEETVTQEEVEQIDELSKETLGRYVQKRVKQIPNIEVNYQMAPDRTGPFGANRIKKFQKKVNKGVTGALNRLSGTDVTKKPTK
jgi:hypothetical protein